MPEPHETILVRIAADSYGQDKFEFSGSFSDGWESNPALTLEWRNDCSGDTAGKVYKFDQSDPSNAYYRLGFSFTDDPYDAYGGYDKLDEASGVFYYGTPGQSGASTKFHVGILFSGQPVGTANSSDPINPFADTSTSHDYGEYYFDFQDVNGQGCTSGNYGPPTTSSSATSSSTTSSSSTSSSTGPSSSSATSSSVTSSSSSSCDIHSFFSGELNTLIAATNTTQSGIYSEHSTLSYSVTTGVETGQFPLGLIVATGASLSDALADLTPLISHFNTSGVMIDERSSTTSTVNINNNTTSYSSVFSGLLGSGYFQGVTGYADKRYYVGYNPEISGNYSGASVATTCPETSLRMTFNRNRQIFDTTGILSLPQDTITQFVASLDSTCVGYETNLSVSCSKFINGEEKYGKITFSENIVDAWTGDFEQGSYTLRYESGSFTTSLGKHTLGSGTINVDRYV